MKFLLDQGLPRSTVHHLARAGIASEHAGDLGMSAATDEQILNAARQRMAVVATLDADFHRLLATSRATSPSVVRIRVERLKGDAVAVLLERVLRVAAANLATGAVVSVTKTRIRVHSLPIGP
jgi:predicted nuclease of predicted toxin-antitoxin system